MPAPISNPIIEPSGPARGKDVVPGITKAPHPTAQPNAKAQTESGDKYFEDSLCIVFHFNNPLRNLIIALFYNYMINYDKIQSYYKSSSIYTANPRNFVVNLVINIQ